MTYNIDPKTKKITLSINELMSSQYDIGMQNRKLERQAIKGLTPKFCYASNDGGGTQSFTGAGGYYALNAFDTNDNRMNVSDNKIIIPATGLYVLFSKVFTAAFAGSTKNFEAGIHINGSVILENNCYEDETFLIMPVILNQGDEIQLHINPDNTDPLSVFEERTRLRAISYVLY